MTPEQARALIAEGRRWAEREGMGSPHKPMITRLCDGLERLLDAPEGDPPHRFCHETGGGNGQ